MSQLFHPRANTIARVVIVAAPCGAVVALAIVIVFPWTPYATRQGRFINQPVPFSHEHHVGGLGLDCRYCHTTVEQGPFAGMPTTETCMNCHSQIWTNAAMLEPVRESWRTNQPIGWTRVHDMPDYVYFDHSIHVAKGVACVTCHGRVDQMPLVRKAEPMTMSWCLDCHRDPQPNVVPREQVFSMEPGRIQHATSSAEPTLPTSHPDVRTESLTNCSKCHR